MRKSSHLVSSCLTLLFLISTYSAHATHFRYGFVSSSPGAGIFSVNVKLQNAWRRDAYTTDNFRCIDPVTLSSTDCTHTSDVNAGVGDVIVEQQGASFFDWGDGSPLVGAPAGMLGQPLLYLVTSIDPEGNWIFVEAVDPDSLPLVDPADAIDTVLNHTYASDGVYEAALASCCRLSRVEDGNEHINNPDASYRVATTIWFTGGLANSSPVSVLPPIVRCPIDDICTFVVPGSDPNGDNLKFRLATAAEASGGSFFLQPGEPGSGSSNLAFIDLNTGIYSWDTTGAIEATAGRKTLYSTQVIIENESYTDKVALDFLIELVAAGDPNLPVIEVLTGEAGGSEPICNTTQVITLGTTKTFDIVAADSDGDLLNMIVAGQPATATFNPGIPFAVRANPISSTFTWTPDETGTFLMNFDVTSYDGPSPGGALLGSVRCPVELVVTMPTPCDADLDGNVDIDDISAIVLARNTDVTLAENLHLAYLDMDGDNVLSILDARQCMASCSNLGCAP